jgi:hypothetical protein
MLVFFLFLMSWGKVWLSPLGMSATVRPVEGTRLMDDDAWEAVGAMIDKETEVLSHCHFVHHKSHMTWPGLEPEQPRWEANK